MRRHWRPFVLNVECWTLKVERFLFIAFCISSSAIAQDATTSGYGPPTSVPVERSTSARVDLLESPEAQFGNISAGTVHHIAFRCANEEEQLRWREKLVDLGLQVTPVIDRQYFHSIYFREPSYILFEIATDGPGFTIDEPVDELGRGLKLPRQLEPQRKWIEQALPAIELRRERGL